MRRLGLLFLAGLQLCRARQPGFSIHHDILAYPQFEVVFSEAFISEPEAQALIETATASQEYEADFKSRADVTSNIRAAAPEDTNVDDEAGHKIAETYEIMELAPHRYLCAVPIIEPPVAPNKTATELAKAEEARELERASAHGWELINALQGQCLYYVSGWWSYSFCFGQQIVQFHAQPAGIKGGPPVRDPNSQEYVLGRAADFKQQQAVKRGQGNTKKDVEKAAPQSDDAKMPPNTELQEKGDQRYLVQRLDSGTVCDLTGRDRTIEIQYHCAPGTTQDRIAWIKEVTTCAYLMVVNTPRLCADVAFQPPQETRANIISCRAIVPEAEQAEWHARKTLEAQAAMMGQKAAEKAQEPVVIGGVVVGGRQMLGQSEEKIAPPRNFNNGKMGPLAEILAQATTGKDGKKVETLSNEELREMELDPELVEQLKEEIQKLAGDKGWKLEVVDIPGEQPGEREIIGVVDGEDDEDDGQNKEEGSEEQFFKEEL